eukprot:GSMAST32.ASY1.ANO1.1091.1 assembled CDS
MGQRLSRMIKEWWHRNERRCLLVGLDNAGKTTILYRMHSGETHSTTPTVGFNVETVKIGRLTLNIWDVGGQDRLRPYWRHYYTGTQGIIYVVDASDRERIQKARDEFVGSAIMVLANKQDMPGALSVAEMESAFEMERNCGDRKCIVLPSTATTGAGLETAFKWLSENMS